MARRLLLLLLLVVSIYHSGFTSPAYPNRIKFTQPDGSKITITLKGDEHKKWALTTDGYTLLSNSKGYFEYAITDSRGYLVPSGVIAKDIEKRNTEDQKVLSKISKGLYYSAEQLQMLKSIKAIKAKESQKSFPTTGTRKLVCILMGFKDKAFTKTQEDFNNLFNQENYNANGATGSVKDFYLENSYGQFNLTVTVAGPYTASQNMSYYGANNAVGDDVKPEVLVTEAVTAADATVNYADFDNDNDGYVDGVYVIYAGYGEESGAPASTIWAHAWQIPEKTLDGKIIHSYSCSSELTGTSGTTMTSIGVICHEFGHVLGAPDYYDTDGSDGLEFSGTGDWDLMASGSWNNDGITPAHHNAFTKVMVYGWGTATTLNDGAIVSIPSSRTDANAFYRINTATTNEYYLIENRQKAGFDAYLPGHGFMIYHVSKDVNTYFDNNDINVKAPQNMYPVCASATSNPGSTVTSYGNINSAGCPFPGTSNKTSFTDATTPSMKSWLGAATNKPITNISENISTGIITFNFNGGNPDNPSNFNATAISTSQIDLSWNKSADRDVIVAYSTSPTFGSLVNGNSYTLDQPITGGGTILYQGNASTFNHTNLNSNTTYYYKVWTKLTSTPTYSVGIATQARTACPGISTLPLTEDFNTGNHSGCWTIIDKQGNGQVWQIGSVNGGLSGTYLYLNSDGYGEDNTQNSDFITPAINTIGINSVTISFKHYFRVETAETATLSYSIDGTNWIQLDQWTATTTNPSNYKKVLTEVANKPSVKFKWNYTGTWGWYWCIDDISITETPVNEVIANFKAEPTTINIGESTTFTSLSNGTVTSWAWDFGSGATPSTATTAGPHAVTYSSLGNKTVTLTINGNVTETKTNYINIVDPNVPLVIIGWRFEDSNVIADEGIAANTNKTITTNSSGTISYSTGSGGTGTNALTNTGWDNGNGTKAWQTEFSTLGYNTITVSSKQKSSGTGPKEFKLQYKTSGSSWIDVPSSNTTLANDNYALGVLTNIALPSDAANQPSVSLRWVMRSNLQVSSGNVAAGGTSRIDDIIVNGKRIDTPTQYTLSVSHVGNGTVTPIDGETTHDAGATVTLTATPDQGWQFEKWEINGNVVNSASTQIIINSNATAKATFTKITYTLTVSHVGNGTVTPTDGETTHDAGATVTLTATPDQGWQLEKWEINGNAVNSASTQITINSNTTAKATFTKITYTLTVSHVGNGTVIPTDGETTHDAGATVTLTATPDQGWQFEKWEINGNVVNSASTQIIINSNATAKATFTKITYTLTVSHVGNGTVIPTDGETTHDAGATVTLTATPDQGWQFEKWEINGNNVNSASTQITINSNTTAVATFTVINGVDIVENQIAVYPNPTTSVVNIKSDNVIRSIQVLDITGRILNTKENILDSKTDTDLSGFAPGMYLLRVISTDNSVQIIKISKK